MVNLSGLEMDMKDFLGNLIVSSDISGASELGPNEIDKLSKDVLDTDVTKIISLVEGITQGDILPIEYGIFDYQGFNPETVIRVMKVYQDHYHDPSAVLLSDIRFAVAATLYMGNLQAKSLSRRSMQGAQKINYLILKYDIRIGSQGAGLPPTVLTFPRIAAAVPLLAVRMACRIPPKVAEHNFLSSKVPACMRLMPFAALCSRFMGEELRTVLLQVCNAHGSDMAIAYVVGEQKKKKVPKIEYNAVQIARDQWSYIEVVSNSPVPSERSKQEMIMELNLGPKAASILEVCQNYRAVMQSLKPEEVKVMGEQQFQDELGAYLALDTSKTSSS
nr:MAG: coat protein [Jiangsu sediment phenui-like virus]